MKYYYDSQIRYQQNSPTSLELTLSLPSFPGYLLKSHATTLTPLSPLLLQPQLPLSFQMMQGGEVFVELPRLEGESVDLEEMRFSDKRYRE